jgi:hypothetical protein
VVQARAVARGAAVAVATCLPLALVSRAVADDGDGSPLTALLFLLVLAGLAVGGLVAARSAVVAPFTNGGLAALLAFVAIQGVALAVRSADGDPVSLPALVFNGLLAYGCGLAGAAVATRRQAGTREAGSPSGGPAR